MTTSTPTFVLPGTRISAAELRSWLATDVAPHVLDVRTPAEFETVHIPGSTNVPLGTLREHGERLAGQPDAHIVLVCGSGMRAKQGERTLAAIGLSNVAILDGGVTAWEVTGERVERGVARWSLDRQVRLIAGGIVVAAGLGSFVVPHLRWIATAVGAGLVTSAVTDTCALGAALSKRPYNRGVASCSVGTAVTEPAPGMSSRR